MNRFEPSISSCRHCRYYVSEGRRGGSCQKLNVSVKSQWAACSLSDAPFMLPWNGLGDIMIWQQKALEVQGVVEANILQQDFSNAEIASPPMPMTSGVDASSRRI